MQNFQSLSTCVLSLNIVFEEVLQGFFSPELELLPNNRESTPPTDSNQENTRNTCEDRNKLVVDKL